MSTFWYHGLELPYFDHLYNLTWNNERRIEIPVANWWMTAYAAGQGVEVGNVIGHYGRRTHDVVDRYEEVSWYQDQNVQNIDVFEMTGCYDWILSLSTIEHVGIDNPPHDPSRAVAALAHLRSLLVPGGRMLITFPTGYNRAVDEMVMAGTSRADRCCTLSRGADGVEWWVQKPNRRSSRTQRLQHGLRPASSESSLAARSRQTIPAGSTTPGC